MLETNKIPTLKEAITLGGVGRVSESVRGGGDVNAPIGSCQSALEYALECCPRIGEEINIMRNLWPMWSELVIVGADVNRRLSENSTLLHKAVQYGLFEFSQFLVEKGADCNAVDDQGKSVVDVCLSDFIINYDILKFLLENGAQIPNAIEVKDQTAKQIVEAHAKVREISDVNRLLAFLSTADTTISRVVRSIFDSQCGIEYLALVHSGRDVNSVYMDYRMKTVRCVRDYRKMMDSNDNEYEYANPLIAFLNQHSSILDSSYIVECNALLVGGSRNSVHITPQIKQLDGYLDSLYVKSYRAVEQAALRL